MANPTKDWKTDKRTQKILNGQWNWKDKKDDGLIPSTILNQSVDTLSRQLQIYETRECQNSLYRFVIHAWPTIYPTRPFQGGWHIEAMCDHLQALSQRDIRNLIINIPRRHSKALADDTPIFTTWGWKVHGSLVPGDYVFGPDGLPKLVLAVTEPWIGEGFSVQFDDRTSLTAAADHLWQVDRCYSSRPGFYKKHRITEVVATNDLISRSNKKKCLDPDRIRMAQPVQTPPKRLLVDPYLLGVWLGDGGSNDGVFYVAEQDIEHFSKYGEIRNCIPPNGTRQQNFYRLRVANLRTNLRVLGLLGNKHIPDDYLEASVAQRWALVQGLMDTDGTCYKDGECGFVTALSHLSDQFKRLLESLGVKVHPRVRYTKLKGKTFGPHYHITFTGPSCGCVFRLQRKQDRVRKPSKTALYRYIVNVERVGQTSLRCIQVEGDIYLAGHSLVSTHNSSIVSVMWPAWVWCRDNINFPTANSAEQFMFASYGHALSIRDSVRCRRVIESDWYLTHFPHFTLTSDQNTKIRFDNSVAGYRFATSIGGMVLGDGGDCLVCLPGESLITTDFGDLPIGRIVEERLPVRVLGPSGRWQTIETYEKNPGQPLVELETESGPLTCTEDHPPWLEGRGFCPATEGISNAVYLRLLRDDWRTFSGTPEAAHSWAVLFAEVYGVSGAGIRESRLEDGVGSVYLQALQAAWEASEAQHHASPHLLFSGMQTRGQIGTETGSSDSVWSLSEDLQSEEFYAAFLQSGMRFRESADGHSRGLQRALEDGRVDSWLYSRLHEDFSTASVTARREPLRAMFENLAVECASHRRKQGGSFSYEPGNTLCLLPSQAAPGSPARLGSRQDAPIRVSATRRLPAPAWVYNLQVSGDHAYYANGFLTHNCDDPNNLAEIHVERARLHVIDWYREVFLSGLNDPKTGVKMIIQQRGHSRDLTGYLLDSEPNVWTHLCLPTEYHPKYHSVNAMWKDPRTQEGELLWPDRFDRAYISKLRVSLGSYAAAAQLDQRPVPAEGGVFNIEWFKTYDPSNPPKIEEAEDSCLSIDMSFGSTNEKTASYTVAQAWMRIESNIYLLDQIRGLWEYVESKSKIRAFARKWSEIWAVLVENKANGPAILSDLATDIPGMIPIQPEKTKEARARAVSPVVEAGRVFIPDPTHPLAPLWLKDFIAEVSGFPRAPSDDIVDSLSQALSRMRLQAVFGVSVEDSSNGKTNTNGDSNNLSTAGGFWGRSWSGDL